MIEVQIAGRSDVRRAVRGISATAFSSTSASPHEDKRDDARLLDMVAAWGRQAHAVDRADDARCDAEKECKWPAVPDALFCRPSDPSLIRRFAHHHHSGRDWYGFGDAIGGLRRLLAERPFAHPDGSQIDRVRDRGNEIIASANVFDATRDAARVACGLARAEAGADRMHERNRVLRRKIVETSAHSIAGVVAKAKIVRWCFAGDLAELTAALADLLERNGPTGETIAFGLAVDLVRLLDDASINGASDIH